MSAYKDERAGVDFDGKRNEIGKPIELVHATGQFRRGDHSSTLNVLDKALEKGERPGCQRSRYGGEKGGRVGRVVAR